MRLACGVQPQFDYDPTINPDDKERRYTRLILAVEYMLERKVLESDWVSDVEEFKYMTFPDKVHLAARCTLLKEPRPAQVIPAQDAPAGTLSRYTLHSLWFGGHKKMFVARLSLAHGATVTQPSFFFARTQPAQELAQFHYQLTRVAEPYFYTHPDGLQASPAIPMEPFTSRIDWRTFLKWEKGLSDDQLNSWSYHLVEWPEDSSRDLRRYRFSGVFRLDTHDQHKKMMHAVQHEKRRVTITFIRTWELHEARRKRIKFKAQNLDEKLQLDPKVPEFEETISEAFTEKVFREQP
ncbi:hypothetical protein GGR52DRAFT_569186 [Hypoxylon sp. FL1284]|nr:hypothetical protein GGR52DRAFT_569186 [Hypoxylon sp. FL1284]